MFRHHRNGREIRESLGTRDEAEAIRKAQAILNGPELREAGDFTDEIEKYFAERKREDRLSKNAIESRRGTLKRFFELAGKARVDTITQADAQTYYDGLRIAEETKHTYVRHLRTFYKWLIAAHRVRENPFANVKMARLRPVARKSTLNRGQVEKLFSECSDDSLKFVLFCGFHAGMRKDEVIEARPQWFDLESGHIHIGPTETWIPKDRDRRSVPISKAFAAFLKTYGKPSPYMLAPTVKRGKARYRYDFRRPFSLHLKACKIECTFHDARRTFASLMVSGGVSVYKVARWLGDGVGVVEKHYGHLQPDNGDLERVLG